MISNGGTMNARKILMMAQKISLVLAGIVQKTLLIGTTQPYITAKIIVTNLIIW